MPLSPKGAATPGRVAPLSEVTTEWKPARKYSVQRFCLEGSQERQNRARYSTPPDSIYAAEVSQFIVQSGAAPTIARLEQTWHEVKADLHAEIHYENADNVVMGQWRQELFARGSSRPGMR